MVKRLEMLFACTFSSVVWKTHEIIPPRTRKFATIRKNWPLQKQYDLMHDSPTIEDAASPYSRDPNKMHFLAKVVWFQDTNGEGLRL